MADDGNNNLWIGTYLGGLDMHNMETGVITTTEVILPVIMTFLIVVCEGCTRCNKPN